MSAIRTDSTTATGVVAPRTPKARLSSDPSPKPRPVVQMAVIGALLLAFEIYVLAKWVFGPHFTPTPPGPDPISPATLTLFTVMQTVIPIGTLVCFWFWVVRPWRREGHLPTSSMFVLAGAMLFFWDMCMNYTSITLFYNSHLLNFGAWANDSWPGWTSPAGNRLPEPLLIVVPAYTCLVFVQVMFILWLLRKAKARWPGMGFFGALAVIVVGLTLTDTFVEGTVLRTGIYAYPGGIRALTLFAGETYQVPMTETFFFGGLGLGAIAAMMHFRDDKGHTIVERGLDRVPGSDRRRQIVKFLAVFGAVHLAFAVLYMAPNQWLSSHSDPFPAGYPSYMENGMCASGADGRTCPGPGVPMPRPTNNPF
ncbi:MAG TPA: spirocyclase AveC family protein [Pseudonocardia sp.]|nr:spirocyclase AveC family protein [Pseudonocardia sp.]